MNCAGESIGRSRVGHPWPRVSGRPFLPIMPLQVSPSRSQALYPPARDRVVGPRLRPSPEPLSTGPLRFLLQVVSPREGGPTSLLRAEPSRTPWGGGPATKRSHTSPNPGPGSKNLFALGDLTRGI
ncbi:hypothetical protein F2P79_022715 [Pimephales promelas]|nr:hypothetical protein F2P79_022715 [Pimephales promelas]